MSKTDTFTALQLVQQTLENFDSNYFFKLHKIFKPTPVNKDWVINKGRKNSDFHMLFVIKGTGNYHLDGEAISMKKGQLFFVSNDFAHDASANQHDLVHIFSLRFGIYETSTGHFLPNFFDQPFGTLITPKDPERYDLLFNRLYHHYLEQKPLSSYAINTLLSQILLNLCEEADQSDTNNHIQSISRKIIQKHGNGINVTSLAAQMNLSTKQFTRLFQKENLITPHQFIIKTRINHAKYLLEETHLTVSEIATELGYSDAFTFSKQFKKVTGISPSTFRL